MTITVLKGVCAKLRARIRQSGSRHTAAKPAAHARTGLLCDAPSGRHGVVARLATHDRRQLQKMMALGVLPGTPIQLIQNSPAYVFQLGYSQFAVDRPLAAIIVVNWNA